MRNMIILSCIVNWETTIIISGCNVFVDLLSFTSILFTPHKGSFIKRISVSPMTVTKMKKRHQGFPCTFKLLKRFDNFLYKNVIPGKSENNRNITAIFCSCIAGIPSFILFLFHFYDCAIHVNGILLPLYAPHLSHK